MHIFNGYTLLGRLRNFFRASTTKKLMLVVFGKMLANEYQLQIRLCKPSDVKMIEEEHRELGEQHLIAPVHIFALYKDMNIAVAVSEQEWKIQKAKQTVAAEYLWRETPLKTFLLERGNSSAKVLKATLLLSQESNDIDPVEVYYQIMEVIVDSTGGMLHLKEADIKLEIHSEAIEGKKVKVTLEHCFEETDMPVLHPRETIISPIVKCGPEGTIFNKPCLLSFPHDAVNEENWEFTLLVKDRIQDDWKQIALKSDEKDVHFTLSKGLCCITLNHFTWYTLRGLGKLFRGMKKMSLLVFGKMLGVEYQLETILCKPSDNQVITIC
ncbi:uncharacterized protein [Antedon mediterranea]|uniref:uncharacterized protein n=1 Tax=Antedon mediterranea TaxID=105859 RepID=UPI003AF45A89